MSNAVEQVSALGQSVWYDNIRRGLIESGELQRLIDVGVTGLTSNPTIFEKAIAGSADYDDDLIALAREGRSAEEILEALSMDDIRAAADLLRPTYDATGGRDGYASLEVSPHLAHDTGGTVEEAARLFDALDRPNVMIKIPATPEGIPAVREAIGRGINVNVTLIFSRDAYSRVRDAYVSGLEDLSRSSGDVDSVSSVASFFVSRVDTAVDTLLEPRSSEGGGQCSELLGAIAVANARLAYRAFEESFASERFAPLRAAGARVQRPLWASTGTKNPAYSDVLYVDSLIGPDTVNTMPDATLTAFLEHGAPVQTIDEDVEGARSAVDSLQEVGVDLDRITDGLLADGVKAFADSYDQLLSNIEQKVAALRSREHTRSAAPSSDEALRLEPALNDLKNADVVGRIWGRDHTVWGPSADESADRLGWLTVTDAMREQLPALRQLAEEVRQEGVRRLLLLGMGGSSLGPDVLCRTLGSADYPDLTVLDSTVPSAVRDAAGSLDPARTLFIVSSKSGETLETRSLYAYFSGLLSTSTDDTGARFVAITDAGTPLHAIASEQGFRRLFLNPPDIGGRYSVLSYFGLVPAALAGVDVETLLDSADEMRESCGPAAPTGANPGARLGAAIGAMASRGRDKLTLVASPSMDGLARWVEQLVAESTGKDGRGVVPVAEEPLLAPEHYGDDRLFVYTRVEGDDNRTTDRAVASLESAGQPVVRLEMRDAYDLGAELFRWQLATAIAAALIGVRPFDQPDVEHAKRLTAQLLRDYATTGRVPDEAARLSPEELLSQAGEGDYLSIMVYSRQTPKLDEALFALRKRVAERRRVATTLGYAPRLLHSTGQLHKGGPNTGLHLQIVAQEEERVPAPGEAFCFGTLLEAQAVADLAALEKAGRRVARLSIDADGAAAIDALGV